MLSLLPVRVLAQNESDTWSIYRPSSDTPPLEQRVQNATTDEEASVGIGVDILRYFENAPDPPYEDKDGVRFRVVATANTRKGINYQSSLGVGLMDWIEANTPIPGMDPPGDDDRAWVELPFPVRFYGGPGAQGRSAEYSGVWVSSNGFLSFDSDSTGPNPTAIPDPSEPNTLLAVYWSDLDPSAGTIKYYADVNYFVVTWRNVLDKFNRQPQTFEVIISNTRVPSKRGQNEIEFLYESVAWSTSARAGIEDQEGYKGAVPLGAPESGQNVHFIAPLEAPEIKKITIKLQKSDSYAEIYPSVDYYSLKGYNVEYTSPDPDPDGYFENALWGYVTLLVTTFIGTLDPVSGFLLEAALVTVELAPDLARALYPADELDYKPAGQSDDVAYVKASAAYAGSWMWPVDAILGDLIEWVFTDNNDRDHSVTVTAELEYYSYQTLKIEKISTSVKLSVKIYHDPGGNGGSCPFVSTWSGTEHWLDNNVLPASETSNGTDVEDYYVLQQPLVPYNGKYSLLISEFEQEHSHLDQVRLIAVDHESDANVGVSPNGDILTYRSPHAPVSAVDEHNSSWLDTISTIDNGYYEGHASSYLVLDFGDLNILDGVKLVIRSDTPEFEEKSPVYIQTLNSTGHWHTRAVIHTRVYWSTDIIDLSEYLPDANGNLKVRLLFVSNDKIDFVGLDTTKQADFDVRYANLVSATHSEQGSVKVELTESDDIYAELVPNQQIELAFTLPENTKDTRVYIIYVKGYYYTI